MLRELDINEVMITNGGETLSDIAEAALCLIPGVGPVAYVTVKAIKYNATNPTPARTTTRGGVKYNVPAYRP